MNVEYAEAELAYTYAWWLTGSDSAARTAVLAAVDRPDVPGADPELRQEILLRRVRAAAVAAPTMCPASELALLHDAIGLGLDSAAGLALIDAREARTELAHGRLEALGPDATFEITEPHRLGGLAVGNPADVAAARQNDKLAALREAILQGRDELVTVSRIEVPADLLEAVAGRRTHPLEVVDFFHDADPAQDTDEDVAEEAPDEDVAEEAPDEDVADGDEPTPADEGPEPVAASRPPMDLADIEVVEAEPEPTEAHPRRTGHARHDDDAVMATLGRTDEIDLTAQMTEEGADRSSGLRLRWLLLTMVVLAGVAAFLLNPGGATGPSDEVADEPTAGPPAVTEPAPTEPAVTGPTEPAEPEPAPTEPDVTGPTPTEPGATEPAPTDAPQADAFTVVRAGVAVGIGGDPDFDNPVAGQFDPVSVTVEYTGAEDGDALIADWTVDGQPFATERADLSPLLSTSRFTKQVPEEGWPAGQHTLTLTLERTGEVVGQALFTVQIP